MDHKERLAIEREAREAAPWADADTERADYLRRLTEPTTAERRELSVLRQREINYCVTALRA